MAPADAARAALAGILQHSSGMARVHAADVLIEWGDLTAPRAALGSAEPTEGAIPVTRIGVWRILVRAANDPATRAMWLSRIEAVVYDSKAPDRSNAIETLCKIGIRPEGRLRETMWSVARSGPPSDAVFAAWSLCLAEEPGSLELLKSFLAAPDSGPRLRAAYALSYLKPAGPLPQLAIAADAEPPGTAPWAYITGAAYGLNAAPARAAAWKTALAKMAADESAMEKGRMECCRGIAARGDAGDAPFFLPLLSSASEEVRISAASAILRLGRPSARP